MGVEDLPPEWEAYLDRAVAAAPRMSDEERDELIRWLQPLRRPLPEAPGEP